MCGGLLAVFPKEAGKDEGLASLPPVFISERQGTCLPINNLRRHARCWYCVCVISTCLHVGLSIAHMALDWHTWKQGHLMC